MWYHSLVASDLWKVLPTQTHSGYACMVAAKNLGSCDHIRPFSLKLGLLLHGTDKRRKAVSKLYLQRAFVTFPSR
jgi:hypothetical protein